METKMSAEEWQEQLRREIYAPAMSGANEGFDSTMEAIKQSPYVRHWLLYSVAFAGVLLIGCSDPLARFFGGKSVGSDLHVIAEQALQNGIFFWRTLGGFLLGSALLERILIALDRSFLGRKNQAG